jgi:hypothetical protein
VANLALVLGLGGVAGSIAQQHRVIDPDTAQACARELVDEGPVRQYDVGEPVFAGPTTIRADFTYTGRAALPPQTPAAGTLRCTVSAGDEIDDPMVVEHVEAVR